VLVLLTHDYELNDGVDYDLEHSYVLKIEFGFVKSIKKNKLRSDSYLYYVHKRFLHVG